MGKVKIAQILSCAGLHLGVTTIGRMLKDTVLITRRVVVPRGA